MSQVAPNQSFVVAPNELSRKLGESGASEPLTLRGKLYRKPAGKQRVKPADSFPFEILEIIRLAGPAGKE